MNKRVRQLATKWMEHGIPEDAEFAGLTAAEITQVVVLAGYDSPHELIHKAMRKNFGNQVIRRLKMATENAKASAGS